MCNCRSLPDIGIRHRTDVQIGTVVFAQRYGRYDVTLLSQVMLAALKEPLTNFTVNQCGF